MRMKIVVIGGGASGIVSAIHAKTKENEVLVLEREKECLKKLLKTGNGRCNYYNENQKIEYYHSSNQALLNDIITKENLENVLQFFKELGIFPRKRDGYYYPNSNQAVSIKNAFLLKVKELGIKVITDCRVTSLEKKENQFVIKTNHQKVVADKVIVSTGSFASFSNIKEINSYQLLENLGHHIRPVLPSLVQLKGKGPYLKDWAGIRTQVKLSLYENKSLIKEEEGEIQLTNYGISGICTFNISREVSLGLYQHHSMKVEIDFLPMIDRIEDFLEERYHLLGNRTCYNLLEGVLSPKLIATLLTKLSIPPSKKYKELTKIEKNQLFMTLKKFSFPIVATNDFSSAQVAVGGVFLEEVDIQTMASLKVKNLYITGEVLDVDGICGGYNLTFAWISGMLAGRSASSDSN